MADSDSTLEILINLSSIFVIDFTGKTRAPSGPWDIGAYQFTAFISRVISGGGSLRGGGFIR